MYNDIWFFYSQDPVFPIANILFQAVQLSLVQNFVPRYRWDDWKTNKCPAMKEMSFFSWHGMSSFHDICVDTVVNIRIEKFMLMQSPTSIFEHFPSFGSQNFILGQLYQYKNWESFLKRKKNWVPKAVKQMDYFLVLPNGSNVCELC
jgi:hypothetical protein